MKKKLFSLLIYISIFTSVFAQQAGDNDDTFNSTDRGFGFGDGTDYSIKTVGIQSDGKVIIGGWFTTYNTAFASHIVRINADGSLDVTFTTGSGASDVVETIAIQSDDKIIIGGSFATFNGITVNGLTRLNSNGTIDNTFTSGLPSMAGIAAVALQVDGKIIISGNFTLYNGTTRHRIARLNSNGTLDTTFDPGAGPNEGISSAVVQNDGKIIIGGWFTTFNGTATNYIARLNANGSVDNTFNIGSGTNLYVFDLEIQSDGKIIIVGNFISYNGTTTKGIARLNADGSIDNTFNSGSGANSFINNLLIQSDGKIAITGGFTNFNGTAIAYIARLNANGSLDATFDTGTGSNGSGDIAQQTDGKLIIGGDFRRYNGNPINHIARLNTNGSLDMSFNMGSGANDEVEIVVIQNDGKIIIGGQFLAYNGTPVKYITHLTVNGLKDAGFAIETGPDDRVGAISLQNSNKIIIAGGFLTYDGTSAKYIARLNPDGSLDATFNSGGGVTDGGSLTPFISTIAVQSDNKIIIGGYIGTEGGIAGYFISRLNSDGTPDPSFDPGTGVNNNINTIVIQSDGKIIVGGKFTTYNDATANYIVRLNNNGSMDNTFTGTGTNDIVSAIAIIQSDNKIIIGGEFTAYNGANANYITRLNSDGTSDNSFTSGTRANEAVNTIAIQNDGKIIAGGNFTAYSGTNTNRIVRLNSNGIIDNTFNPGAGANGVINVAALQSDGNIIIGGSFAAYNATGRNRIARVTGGSSAASITNTFFKTKNSTIYPNPAAGKVYIELENVMEKGKILLINSIGQILLEQLFSEGNCKIAININGLPEGIYHVQIDTEIRKELRKIIVNR